MMKFKAITKKKRKIDSWDAKRVARLADRVQLVERVCRLYGDGVGDDDIFDDDKRSDSTIRTWTLPAQAA